MYDASAGSSAALGSMATADVNIDLEIPARLVKERDEARTANAALQGRAERSERAVQDMAGKFEDMVSRVTRAEAALRAVQKAA